MGFRHGAVLASVSFFLGVLFICYNVDHRLLFQPLTDDVVADGFRFYTTFYNAPLAVKGLLHGMIGMGILSLISKLHEWDESAIFFDGSSLALFVFSVVIYVSVTISMLRTIVHPTEQDTHADRIDALRVLSAGNTLMALCLLGVLLLQGGQEYARRAQVKMERKEKKDRRESETKDAEPASTTASSPVSASVTSLEDKKTQ